MASTRSSKRSRAAAEFLQKPRGIIHPRVQQVGPEHFGIVSADCAKARCGRAAGRERRRPPLKKGPDTFSFPGR